MLAANDGGLLKNLGFEKVNEDQIPSKIKEDEDVKNHLQKNLPIFLKKAGKNRKQ
ncbi:MAG: hypothetical protein LRY73_07890 [Bacillus sp. (in: Bacteria)]|nr:hypothetical protein [Bacillus sp. (in: firmicutes)]